MVVSKSMEGILAGSSAIRKMFEEGMELAKKIGAENVYDFSLGNPASPVPDQVKNSIDKILASENPNRLHNYMPNAGYIEVRETISDSLNKRYNTNYSFEDIIMTVGAAGGMNCVLRSLLNPQDEVIAFAPFFGEYKNYAANYQGVLTVVPADFETFQLNLDELDSRINEKTKAVIVDNPNNPSGVVYHKDTMIKLQSILEAAEKRIGHPIYVISDEPYRDLVYDGIKLPFIPDYIKNCIVVFSYSKSLSLSGERIGYMAVSKNVDYQSEIVSALTVANRCLYVNAPSLFQKVVAECVDVKANVEFYDTNRKLLYGKLTELGFECVKPEGAFYLLVKSPVLDEKEFVAKAKEHNILIVAASSFGAPGYIRIAYCVKYDMINKSLKAFEQLARDYNLPK